jgi:hypothetical protein
MATQILKCRNCKAEFTFSQGEQDFFAEHNWLDPVRCKPCRANHREGRDKKQQVKRQQRPAARFAFSDAVLKLLGGDT